MNWRPILVHLAWLAGIAAVIEAVTIGACSLWSWTPLQRHYLSAYVWCSLPVFAPATVEVRWIWKSGGHGKHELATDDDVDASDDGIGMALSRASGDSGWKGLAEGAPQQVPVELLRPGLSGLAFGGESLSGFLLLPEVCGLVVFCYGLYGCFRLANRLMDWAADLDEKHQVARWADPSPSIVDWCSEIAGDLQSQWVKLSRIGQRRTEARPTAIAASAVPTKPLAARASFPFPFFGVHSPAREIYLWTERDEIE